MRKNKFFLVVILVCMMLVVKVNAMSVNIDYQPNIYSNRVNGYSTYYGMLGYITIDNRLFYCLEPYKLIGSNYNLDNNFLTRFSPDDLNYFKLVSYYGYNSTHQSVYYYMAAQELIWRRITNQDVYWTTKSVTKGDRINIEYYKNDIINSINRHYLKPSFINNSISGNYNEIIELNDTNGVLNEYEIDYNGQNKVWKENNKLYIKVRSHDYENIKLVKRVNNNLKDSVYISNDGQTVASFGLDEIINASLSAKANNYSSRLLVTFKDVRDNQIIKDKISFKIKNIDTDEYYIYHDSSIYTAINGSYLTPFYIPEGRYEIEVVDVPNNYVINDENKIFEVSHNYINDDDILEIDETLNTSKGYVVINRYFTGFDLNDKTKTYDYNLSEVKYNLYAKEDIKDKNNQIVYYKDELVDTFETNLSGQAISKYIELGKYYIEEIIEDKQYTSYEETIDVLLEYLDNKTKYIKKEYNIKTAYDILNVELDVKEELKKCKQDKCSTDILPLDGIEYGIFASDDIFFLDEKLYQKDELIKKLKTNQDGTVKENVTLPYGNYYIKEITDMTKYDNKFEDYYLDFTPNEKESKLEIVKKLLIQKNENINNIVSSENQKLPNTYDNYFKYYFLSFLFQIIGIRGMIKNKKV